MAVKILRAVLTIQPYRQCEYDIKVEEL